MRWKKVGGTAGGLALALAVGLVGAPAAAAPQGAVGETPDAIVLTGRTYRAVIAKDGFRYTVKKLSGETLAPAHARSGLRVKAAGAAEFADADDVDLVSRPGAATAVLRVTLTNGAKVTVEAHPFATYLRFTAKELPGAPATVDFRTGPVGPAYGLGDYGAHADGQPDQGTPCSGQVEARPTTELTGITLDNLTNEGSCKRFVTTFTVFPKQRLGQVLFHEGQKRVALNGEENRLGVAGASSVPGLYYFVGDSLKQVYGDYKQARHEQGYPDVKPSPTMFGIGWEAYGALAWNTYQASVMDTVRQFIDHGYPLKWAVVGSGFWPGPRGRATEGTTNSFGMWDDTYEDGRSDSSPGLPNPRYPNPDALKALFADNGIKLMLGARNNFKAYAADGGHYNPVNDGPSTATAVDNGYLLRDSDGTPTLVTRAQFPQGASYVLDATNPAAVAWFVEQSRLWGVDGWKEDTMLYAPDLHRDGNWNPLQKALHDAGDLVMVRNAAYSVPGDIMRINDTIYGTGEVFHEDPDRIPVNLLNFAASGAGNVYGDFVGGTPGPSLQDPTYQRYFMRNAQFNAMTPVLAFGKGPWEMGRDDYAGTVKELALWHDKLQPYIYDAVQDGHATGYPYAMTPLPIAYPDDENTYRLANDTTRQYEWLFGESLLATPVFGSDFATAQSRDVYLPAGKWIDYATGAVFQGPTTLNDYVIGLDRLPAFVGGKGVLVLSEGSGLRAEVYPVVTGSTYTHTTADGRNTRITNANTGWDAGKLTVTDTNTGRAVPFTLDSNTGALKFALAPGHDYRLTGGGSAAHPVPVDTTLPGQVADVTHQVNAAGDAVLSWQPADGARSYVVTASGRGECPSPEESVVGATTGGTTLNLGAKADAGGTYRVYASNNVGAGPVSDPHTVPRPGQGEPSAVVVTNEGSPATCRDDEPAYSEAGTWAGSSLKGVDGSATRYSSTDGAAATWRAALTAGKYEVAAWFPLHTVCSADDSYTVTHAGGDAVVPVDQCANGGKWVTLGTYSFPAADDQLAKVTLTVGTGTSRADAVRFTPVP